MKARSHFNIGWLAAARNRLVALAFVTSAAVPGAVMAESSAFAAAAPERLQAYLRIDTTNPPGNEIAGVKYLGELLEAAGIEYETGESAPGRGNLWAKLPATVRAKSAKPALVLLHHIDVVPANAKYWDTDPLSGEIIDGYIHGRGALDTKGLGIAQLQAFLALAASDAPRNRDVLYIATADEEAGGNFGAGWLVKKHPGLFKNVGFLVNEGGSGVVGKTGPIFAIEVTQKVPLWLRLVAKGRPGHGSAPQAQTAVTKLVRGLDRVATTAFPARVVPAVAEMFRGLAQGQEDAQAQQFTNLAESVKDHEFLARLQMDNPPLHALLRNTCSITRLQGSAKINVVPAQVEAELDCRLLPDQDPAEFIAELGTIINDADVSIEKIMGFTPAVSSTNTSLFKLLSKMLPARYPGAQIVPTVAGGFTDSHFFRDLGIVSYGFAPFVLEPAERRGVHGNNERISVANMQQGTETFFALLQAFTKR